MVQVHHQTPTHTHLHKITQTKCVMMMNEWMNENDLTAIYIVPSISNISTNGSLPFIHPLLLWCKKFDLLGWCDYGLIKLYGSRGNLSWFVQDILNKQKRERKKFCNLNYKLWDMRKNIKLEISGFFKNQRILDNFLYWIYKTGYYIDWLIDWSWIKLPL